VRVLVLVDGEHYPPVTRWGIEAARSKGYDVVAALFLGGTEKVDPTALPDLGLPTLPAGADITGLGLEPSVVAVDDPVTRQDEALRIARRTLLELLRNA